MQDVRRFSVVFKHEKTSTLAQDIALISKTSTWIYIN